jgi:hypothetical protein
MVRRNIKRKRRTRQEVTIEKKAEPTWYEKVEVGKDTLAAMHNQLSYHMKEIRGLRLFSLIVILMLIATLGLAVYFYNLSKYVTEQFCLHEIYPKGYVRSYSSQVRIIGPNGGSIECKYGYYGGLD